ncbi:hypothetical protein GCK32_009957, partial [Trichostrongylus colubriformis]
VTFDEHTSAVTGICWTQSGKAILSASLDGTVRAHDLKRYRNFRTLVCPEPTQLGSLAVDQAGDIVVAGAKEVFNIFVWSMENGSLLDVLSGHQSNIAGISMHGNALASVSWDRTLRLWNIVDSTCETTELAQEGLAVAFSPCGLLVAVLTVDSNVTFYHAKDMTYIGSIDARPDLDPARGQTDLITRQNAAQSKSFTCMQFSPDSALLLLGGDSNNFCMYSVVDRMLVKKFTITENRSLDGVVDAEFGFLGLFQEILPEDIQSPKKSKKKAKAQQEHKVMEGSENSTLAEQTENISKKEKKKTKRKKKEVKEGADEKVMVDAEGVEVTTAEQASSGNEKMAKKKKKKRKAEMTEGPITAKKVKFAVEGCAMESQASIEAEESSQSDKQLESVAQSSFTDGVEAGDSEEALTSPWDELYLPGPILQAIRDLGFKSPTEIQKQVLPLAVRDHCDVLGAAETGSGKTLAYAIPMAARLLELPQEACSKKIGPKAFPIVGGLAQVRQARILRDQKPEVIVATPGRLWAMMKEMEEGVPVCQYLSDWSGLVCLVVDETDRMVEKGHFEEMEDILK